MSSSERESSSVKEQPVEQTALDLSVDATITTEATLKAGVESPLGVKGEVSGKTKRALKKKYEDDSSDDEPEGDGEGSDGDRNPTTKPGRTVVGRSTVGVKAPVGENVSAGSPHSEEDKQDQKKQLKRKVTTNTTVSAFLSKASHLHHGVLERTCGTIECVVSLQSGGEQVEGMTRTLVGEELKAKDKEGGRHVAKFRNAEGKDGGMEESDGGEIYFCQRGIRRGVRRVPSAWTRLCATALHRATY